MATNRVPIVSLALTLCLCSSALPSRAACDPPPPLQEYVVNGTFLEGLDHWAVNVDPLKGSIAMGSGESEGAAVITVTQPDPNVSNVMLFQKAQQLEWMQPDRNYELQFRARAVDQSHPLLISIRVLDAGGVPNTLRLATLTIPVTSAFQQYSVTFHLPGWVTASVPPLTRELYFFAAGGTGTLWLDEIHINEMTERCFNNNPVFLSQFQSGEVWNTAYLANTPIASGGQLPITVPVNDRVFLSRVIPFDASSGDFDLELTLTTTTPQNVGRMYAAFRWEDSGTDYFVYRPFSGLKSGTNTVLLRHTSNTMTDGFPRQYGSPDVVGWDRMHTIGLKFEANGNGPADVTLLSLRLVPDSPPGPLSLTRFSVIQVTSTSALVRWQVDRQANCSVRYGTTTAYGSLAEAGYVAANSLCAVTLSGLTPSTKYHLQAFSLDGGLAEARSGDMTLTTEPPSSAPWVPGAGSANLELGVLNAIDSRDVEEAAGVGFNRVIGALIFQQCVGYPSFSSDLVFQQYAANFLSACAGQGVKALMWPYCGNSIFQAIDNPPPADLSHVTSRVNFLKGFSAFLGYLPWDEPEYTCLGKQEPQLTACVQDLHHNLLEVRQTRIPLDANHLDYMASPHAGADLDPFNDTHDRSMLDDYPIPIFPADHVACSLEKARTYGRPFDFMFQSFQGDQDRNWSGDWPMPSRFPTTAEMRAMAYLSLAHGATGVWAYAMIDTLPPMRDPQYWSPESHAGSEAQWTSLASVAQELKRIGPALAGGTTPPESITASSQQPCQSIDLIKKTLGDYTYVVAINRKAAYASDADPTVPLCPQYPLPLPTCQQPPPVPPVPCCEPTPVATTATFQLGGNLVGSVEVLGESRPAIVPSGGSFTDSFDPLGVHLYRVYTDRVAPTPVTITSPAPGTILKRNKAASITVNALDSGGGVNLITLTITGPPGTTVPPLTHTFSPTQNATWEFSWTPTVNGAYTLQATARDVFNQTGSSVPVPITVTKTGT